MRCFLAVDLDASLTKEITQIQLKIPGNVNLVTPENLHFTISFLGEINQEEISSINEKITKIVKNINEFEININGCGAFPNIKHPKIIWLGSTSSSFYELFSKVNYSLGFEEEPSPHLTIARVKQPSADISQFIEKNKDLKIGQMLVKTIILKKSTLTSKGPIYENLKTFPFQVLK